MTTTTLDVFTLIAHDATMPPTHRNGTDTSADAALAIAPSAASMRQQVYQLIVDRGGLTCDEIEAITGMRHQTCAARLWELEGMPAVSGRPRLIFKSNERRFTRSRRKARVYQAVVTAGQGGASVIVAAGGYLPRPLSDYRAWVADKTRHDTLSGFEVDERDLNPKMRADQQAITQWALRRGRAAEFIITGGGKALNALEWAHQVARRTDRRVIMFAPLAVADQFVDIEAPKWGYDLTYVRNQDEASAAKTTVVISNYELMERFTPDAFSATVWDESSIIKESSSATRNMINRMWKRTPYKLALTATPAPNDHDELGNHAQALGIMPWHEMITRWFIRDSNQADTLRLKSHAEEDFWRWVASWAVCMSKPSDLGFDDAGFILPPLKVEHLEVQIDPSHAWDKPNRFGQASLMPLEALSATELHTNKKATLSERMEAAAAWVNRDVTTPCVVWVERNDEADLMRELLPEAVEVRGDEPFETKRMKLRDFSLGNIRVLITKPAIAGFGMNWQHCHRTVIASMTFSFERTFQLIRRFYRYGQTHEVELAMVSASTEGNVMQALARKEGQYRTMQAAMNKAMRATGLLAQATHFDDYDYIPTGDFALPAWLCLA